MFTLGPTDNQPNSPETQLGHFFAVLSWGTLNALLLPEHVALLLVLFVPLWAEVFVCRGEPDGIESEFGGREAITTELGCATLRSHLSE